MNYRAESECIVKRVIVYLAVSLDGYIANKDGGVSWLGGDGSDPENFGSYPDFIETVDTVVLGYSTYHQIVTDLSPDKWPYEDKKSYVLTHRDVDDIEGISFVSQDLVSFIESLKREDGKDIWICGGASIIRQLHEQSLVDEYILSVVPVILGKGIALFDETEKEVKLRLKSTKVYNGMVDLSYEKR